MKSFNEDLDEYITRVKSSQYVPQGKPKKRSKPLVQKVPEVSEEEIYVEYDKPSTFFAWFSSLFKPSRIPRQDDDLPEDVAEKLEDMEDTMAQMDEGEDEIREGVLSRFLKTMRFARRSRSPSKDELLEDVVPVIDEDVKEVLKILHKWLEKLPNQDLRAFKVSDDFFKYKEILDKYGLIKKD